MCKKCEYTLISKHDELDATANTSHLEIVGNYSKRRLLEMSSQPKTLPLVNMMPADLLMFIFIYVCES